MGTPRPLRERATHTVGISKGSCGSGLSLKKGWFMASAAVIRSSGLYVSILRVGKQGQMAASFLRRNRHTPLVTKQVPLPKPLQKVDALGGQVRERGPQIVVSVQRAVMSHVRWLVGTGETQHKDTEREAQ